MEGSARLNAGANALSSQHCRVSSPHVIGVHEGGMRHPSGGALLGRGLGTAPAAPQATKSDVMHPGAQAARQHRPARPHALLWCAAALTLTSECLHCCMLTSLATTCFTTSLLASGTMLFGESTSPEVAERLLSQAAEAGATFFDSAEMYPVPQSAETQVSCTCMLLNLHCSRRTGFQGAERLAAAPGTVALGAVAACRCCPPARAVLLLP